MFSTLFLLGAGVAAIRLIGLAGLEIGEEDIVSVEIEGDKKGLGDP